MIVAEPNPDPTDMDNSSDPSSNELLNGEADPSTSAGRKKVNRKKRSIKMKTINGGSLTTAQVHPHPPPNGKQPRWMSPPTITITPSADNDETVEFNQECDIEVGGGGGGCSPIIDQNYGSSHERGDSQQLTTTTSSGITDPKTSVAIVDDNQSRHQLAAQTPATMNGSRNNNPSLVQNHLALTYFTHHEYLHPVLQQQQQRRLSEMPQGHQERPYGNSSGGGSQSNSNGMIQIPIRARDAIATTLSALYGKLIVVMGIAFPMAEVISTYIPPSFYEAFYLYLYIVSMIFLLFMYVTLLFGRPKLNVHQLANHIKMQNLRQNPPPPPESTRDSGEESDQESTDEPAPRRSHVNIVIPNNQVTTHTMPPRRHSFLMGGSGFSSSNKGSSHGSFYLRMGAVAFGIGSMIYSGLEFGQYFELEPHDKCHNILLALTPATRMVFIFIQMYFIFLNNEQMKVYRHKIIARFGLMHMIGTNLAVWLNVLIQETKHEILTFYNPENRTLRISHRLGHKSHSVHHSAQPMAMPGDTTALSTAVTTGLRVARGLKGPHHIFECRRTNILGTLVQDASPFLFPCTIEYSLICAAILYVMWRNISHPTTPAVTPGNQVGSSHYPYKRSPHHYSVDCAQAHRGLFLGILALVLTIISLILFFVLISRPEFVNLAVTEVTICELTLYCTSTIATIIGMLQVRHLQYDSMRNFQLDDILLVGAQTGLFLYSTFTVISGQFMMRSDTLLVLITALASICQTAFQTMFILDACRRSAATSEHQRKKPGREIVTFLLVSNLAMWAISTLEKSRAESHPIQLNFYGLWAWTIITHVSMPLAIFYRFHSTVCLCEIWKRTYKMKPK